MGKYEFGELEDRIISLCEESEPDHEAICREIAAGANVNAVNEYQEPFLCQLLNLAQGDCFTEIVKTVLDAGFDCERFGLACIHDSVYSAYNRNFFPAVKLLLEAGAAGTDEEWDDLLEAIGTEESFQRCCEANHECENTFYALYEMVDAARKKEPFSDIALWDAMIGQTVKAVLAYSADSKPVALWKNGKFEIPDKLLLLCGEAKTLIVEGNPNVYTRANSAVRSEINSGTPVEELQAIIGAKIKSISFRHAQVSSGSSDYRQPNILVSFDNGFSIRFTTNFGEVPKENTINYFEVKTRRQ